MKYFSIQCIENAYKYVSSSTKDKFWGILSILYSINNEVIPNVPYSLNSNKLSTFLENTFRLNNKKNYTDSSSNYSVIFSQLWHIKASEYFLVGKPDVLPIILWAYRQRGFASELSADQLFELFVDEFHLPKSVIEDIFRINLQSHTIEYSDKLYDDESLMKLLGGNPTSETSTIKMNKSFVVANAGDLSRGPFFQPLYASLSTLECLMIFPFDVNDYYNMGSIANPKKLNKPFNNQQQIIFYGAPGTGKSHKIKEYTGNYEEEIPYGDQSAFENEIRNYFTAKFTSSNSTAGNYINFILADVHSDLYSNILHKKCNKVSECYNVEDAEKLYNSFLNGGVLSGININGVPSAALKNYIEFLATVPKTYVKKSSKVFRTTFHPDSDYSTFVGCYKPTTIEIPMRDVTGKIIRENGTDVTENKIIYTFVPQAFLKAYVAAWNNPQEKVYLVIEEINRGNCAQIFGDLFQLLDRNENGESDYPIYADNDIVKYLKGKDEEGNDVLTNKEGIEGGKLKLPSNLYIWATMNTSDQSLFPIDSAFKRRWDWQYMPIARGRDKDGNELQWTIDVDGNKYSWWSFLDKINTQIGEVTQSEDKKLGFFFCKANNGVISIETFVGKVVFYLWKDVFKDYGFEGSIFKDADNSELAFNKFYNVDVKGNTIVQKDKVELFLNNLGVELIENRQEEEPEEDEDGNDMSTSTTASRNYDKFSINGVGRYAKNNLASECVKKYIELNPGITAEEVMNNWSSFKNLVPHFMESKEEFDARTDNSKRSHEIQCNGSVLYVAHNGYGSNGKAQVLMDAVNQKGWGLTIERHNA